GARAARGGRARVRPARQPGHGPDRDPLAAAGCHSAGGSLKVLLVRAGALGDVLLLRTAVAALRAAGHRVSLLAPSGPGAALAGPGPGEVERVLPWESAAIARLLASQGDVDPGTTRLFAPFEAIVAFTASDDLVAALHMAAPRARIIPRTPAPPAARHAS